MRAVTRGVPQSFAKALSATPVHIDVKRALEQHDRYVDVLVQHLDEVIRIDADERYPDCCFVEDQAIVVGSRALVPKVGHPSRRGERAAMVEALEYMGLEVVVDDGPATLDGGDVLQLGECLYVGLSGRTNEAAVSLLERVFPDLEIRSIPVRGGLHLKSVCSGVRPDLMLAQRGVLPVGRFDATLVEVETDFAANVVRLGPDKVLGPSDAPELVELLAPYGVEVVFTDNDELRKADSALTCMSVLVA